MSLETTEPTRHPKMLAIKFLRRRASGPPLAVRISLKPDIKSSSEGGEQEQSQNIFITADISAKNATSSSIKMASKSWPFCPECRASLQVDATGSINCRVCPYESNLSSLSSVPSRTTYSADRAVPLWAKSDEEQAALRASKEPSRATVEEPCVRCGVPEVGFYTVQLRSVDEGQTVFYECPACKHTWSINN